MPLLTEEDIRIKEKYLKAPSPKEVSDFLKELGTNYSQFERFYDIPEGTIKHVINLRRDLPVKFWPIIYEKKVPLYGIKYTKGLIKKEKKPSGTHKGTKQVHEVDIKRLSSL